ncbi:MAG: IS1380 family transposase [Chloroflexota bacterium]
MKRFIIEQSDKEIYTSHSGLALVGLCMNRYGGLGNTVARRMGNNGKPISHADVLRSYLGLLCLGKSDFEAITGMRDDTYFMNSLGIRQIPSTETLRQRLDQEAEPFLQVARQCSVELLRQGKARITGLDTGHVPLDADVFPMDNSGTRKEGVKRTYHNFDGYAPIAAYLGLEGWCLGVELRPGDQHGQKGFVLFLEEVLTQARKLTGKKLLLRLDSGHDALENRVYLRGQEKLSFIIKWNPRREDTTELTRRAFAEGNISAPRAGKRVALLDTHVTQEHEGKRYIFRKVVRITERSTDKHGQCLLVPQVTVEGWWTNLDLPMEKIIALYRDHATSEQFHSEFKSDLDLERLPSGKFATNALVMALGGFAYNILRFIGQLGLLGEMSPVRHPAKRRRLKTVIQELIYLAARVIRKGNRLHLRFSCHCPAYQSFAGLYDRLAWN